MHDKMIHNSLKGKLKKLDGISCLNAVEHVYQKLKSTSTKLLHKIDHVSHSKPVTHIILQVQIFPNSMHLAASCLALFLRSSLFYKRDFVYVRRSLHGNETTSLFSDYTYSCNIKN